MDPVTPPPMQTGAHDAAALARQAADGRPEWMEEVAAGLSDPGEYLAYQDGERTVAFAITGEWTRVGRSLAADIRFDDPTVSRRHALVARRADGIRVLDDRSLNGVWVNGERVEWSPLVHGDEILIGRHSLRFIQVAATPAEAPGARAGAGSGS